jgi:hypothetical protein
MIRIRPLLVASLLMFAAPAGALELKPLLYSLIFPGAGEWSLGYKKRALAQFAVEAGCWSANVYYREQAYDKRHAYEAYADAHWTEHDWRLPWDDTQDYYDPNHVDAPIAESYDLDFLRSHYAPYSEDPQHYYENLGKYDWYRWGWDDFSAAVDHSFNRYTYLNMRNASDDDFNVAENFIKILVVARVISLADTYIILRKRELGMSEREIERGWRLAFAPSDPAFSGFRLGLTRSW